MKRCHTTGGGCIGIGARLDDIENDFTLAGRVPTWRAGDADHRRVKRFGAPPVCSPNVGTACDQASCQLRVITEPRRMQRSVALVDLGKTLGEEELVASFQDGCRQLGRASRRSKADLWSSSLSPPATS